MQEKFDVIIIGTGQAAKPLSLAFAGKKRKVAVIESKNVGGSCINYGCTPTKTLIASAKAAYEMKRSAEFGVRAGSIRIDMKKIIERKDRIVKSFRDSSENTLKKNKFIDLIFGTASFIGRHTVKVDVPNSKDRILTANNIFINSGVSPVTPQIEGIEKIKYYTTESLMNVKKVPEHLVIMGGGYIGLEFGQMYRRFGSKVTIIENYNQLLAKEDNDIADEIYKILSDEGIEIFLNADTRSIKKLKNGFQLEVKSGKLFRKIKGSHLLIAAGVKPNTEMLNLKSAGIQTDERGFIKVNDKLETNVNGIYALGDVKGGPAFTHISYDDYRVVKENLFGSNPRSISGRLIPYTLFTDPQLGRIGITEKEAKQKGINYRIMKMPMSFIARSIETGENKGLMKAIVDIDTKQILGCAILGAEGGELMSMFEIAMIAKLPYTELQNAIFAHPLLAESLNTLFSK